MRFAVEDHRFLGFFPPYLSLDPVSDPSMLPSSPIPHRGAALIWNLSTGDQGAGISAVRNRPPGVALFILLPPAAEMESTDRILDLMENCRPHSILPFMKELDPEELVHILRRFPSDFALEVEDYIRWRGIEVDLDTRRLVRKTLQLSSEIRTVSRLSRDLYLSRRALGRRFMTRGLPVPSHWLHFGRILRAALLLQSTKTNLFSIARDLGYPDGFALSNQMNRLTGLRPSLMRDCFGWEWIVEAWLFQEARKGTFSPMLTERLFKGHASGCSGMPESPMAEVSTSRFQVAEPKGQRPVKTKARGGS